MRYSVTNMAKTESKVDLLIPAESIQGRVRELGLAISRDFEGQEVFIVCVLKGAFVFCADLIRAIHCPLGLGFIKCSSYGPKRQTSGALGLELDLKEDIRGKYVIIVEDIVDTGLAMENILNILQRRGPKGLKVAALLSKPSRRKVAVPIDYQGFEIEDQFVVGYGLDDAERFRELPYLGVISG